MTITDKERRTTRGPRRRANVAAVLLFLGTVVLVAGAAFAVALPSSMMFWRGSAHPATQPAAATSSPSAAPGPSAPSPTGLPTTTPSASPTRPSAKQPATPKQKRRQASITYTVKRGDTLSGIAAWFKLHGYQHLFEKNRSVIGSDPDLIRPGQRITVRRDGAMTITRSK